MLGLQEGGRSSEEREECPSCVHSMGPWTSPFIPSSQDLCLGLGERRLKLDFRNHSMVEEKDHQERAEKSTQVTADIT